jgi:hypothetical protein
MRCMSMDGPAYALGAECSAAKLGAPRAVTVKVEGLHSVERRDAVIKGLLGVKGTTSVTVDQRRGAVIVYTHKVW